MGNNVFASLKTHWSDFAELERKGVFSPSKQKKTQPATGNTLLHEAVSLKCDDRIIQQLIIAKADVAKQNSAGKSPLSLCQIPSHARLLIQAGAPVNAKDNSGSTPLFHHVQSHPFKPDDGKEILELLLHSKADPRLRNMAGETPLHLASRSNAVWAVPILLSAGADPSATDSSQVTPLLAACLGPDNSHPETHLPSPDIVKLLIDAKASIDCQDSQSRTPLGVLASLPWPGATKDSPHYDQAVSTAACLRLLLEHNPKYTAGMYDAERYHDLVRAAFKDHEKQLGVYVASS